jgi:hypothetical protein
MTHGNFDALRMLSAAPQLKPRGVTPPTRPVRLATPQRDEPCRQEAAAEIKSKNPVGGPD